MSLFGTSPTEDRGNTTPSRSSKSAGGLFDDDSRPSHQKSASGGGGGLFTDDNDTFSNGSRIGNSSGGLADVSNDASDEPWSMPTPRKQQSRANMIRNLLPANDRAVPDSYIDTFDAVVRNDGTADGKKITAAGVAKVFASARTELAAQTRIMDLLAPATSAGGDEKAVGRAEFNVLLALVGLAQEGEDVSLDGVDERKRNLPQPQLAGLTSEPVIEPVEEPAAIPSQSSPVKPPPPAASSSPPRNQFRSAMVDPEDDPWGSPEAHKRHDVTHEAKSHAHAAQSNGFADMPTPVVSGRTLSQQDTTAPTDSAQPHRPPQSSGSANGPESGWGYFPENNVAAAGFGNAAQNSHQVNPFGGDGPSPAGPTGAASVTAAAASSAASRPHPISRSLGGRTGSSVEEKVLVQLMPEKEGVFMFQHHNYEVASQRRGSKVVRRYSDFVWLLDCLHKRFPFRMLPLLPPKRMGMNGSHLSNDGAFIEKRRRGLARFLNALVSHPILSQEQLVVMFLTVPTELAVWRKQATISVQDEFTDKALPQGLEDSLPATLEELFSTTHAGVRRSAELYINICNIMDRLVKRTEGVAADHGRVASSLASLTETSSNTYATDTNEIPLLNDGLQAMSKHLENCRTLLEDESRGWDEGVLEDLKRQRDALVSVREMFERRERLDKDNIPYLERRIQTNETKLAGLRAKPEGTVKVGEIEKVAESIIKDKESIVQQHNRSIFVKECLRDELITFQTTQYHVSRWNQDWAGERVKYAEMLADNWRRLLDQLEGMPLGD